MCGGAPTQQQQHVEIRRSFQERPLPLMPCRPRHSPTSGNAAEVAVRLDPSVRPTLQTRCSVLADLRAQLHGFSLRPLYLLQASPQCSRRNSLVGPVATVV